MAGIYEDIERPMIPVIARMEEKRHQVDRSVLRYLSQNFAEQIAKLEDKIFEQAGHKFNVGSPKQLGVVCLMGGGLTGGGKKKPEIGQRRQMFGGGRQKAMTLSKNSGLAVYQNWWFDLHRKPLEAINQKWSCSRLFHGTNQYGAFIVVRPQFAKHSYSDGRRPLDLHRLCGR